MENTIVRSRGVSLSMLLAAQERTNMMYKRLLTARELTLRRKEEVVFQVHSFHTR